MLASSIAHPQDSEDSHDSFFMEDADDHVVEHQSDVVSEEKEALSDPADQKTSDTKVLGETKPLSKEEIDKYNEKIRRSGVVYLSSLPTYMKPEKVKYLLGKFGAAMLNGQIVGGKKSGFFHDMIWNIKYLKGFKWGDLMEKLTLEKRLRADRLRVQFAKNRKADEQYLENVSRAEKKEMIEKKRKQSKKSASFVC